MFAAAYWLVCARAAGGGGARRHPVEQRDHILDFGAVEALGDENDLAAAVVIRPALEPGQVVQELLRALDHRRAVGLFGDIHDAFDAQQIGPEILLQGVEQQAERLARDRLVAGEAERGDIAVVQMVMIVVVVIGIVPVMMIVFVMVLVGGGIEPGARVGFAVGIETVARAEMCRR